MSLYAGAMIALAATLGVVWHFWLAALLAPAAVLLVLAIAGLYVVKVTKTRYPQD